MVAPIREKQKTKITALSLFVPEKEMVKKIRRASSGRVSELEALTRKEAFALLRELVQQVSVKTNITALPQPHGHQIQ